MTQCLDKNGYKVLVGSRVRLLELSPFFLQSLPLDELAEVNSMMGEVFEVYQVDEYGCAWVGKAWNDPETGQYISHSFGLESNQMKLVDGPEL